MKKLFLLLLIVMTTMTTKGQTFIDVEDCPFSYNDSTLAHVSAIINMDSIVMLKIDFISMEYKEIFFPCVSFDSKLIVGKDSFELRNIVALKQGTFDASDNNFLGLTYWKDVMEEEVYSCLAIFDGSIKKGITSVTMTGGDDEGWYSFENIKIDNPLQSHVGISSYNIMTATANVNLRAEASTQSEIIETVSNGDIMFGSIYDQENGFYKVIVLNTGNEGYVSKRYVTIGESIEKPSKGMFQEIRNSGLNEPPVVEVFNNSIYTMTLSISGNKYVLKPHVKKRLKITAGKQYYVASIPGINPCVGYETFERGGEYSWEFYVVDKYF